MSNWIDRASLAARAVILVSMLAASAARAQTKVGTIEISGPVQDSPNPYAWLMGPAAEPTLRDLVRAFDAAAERSDLAEVLVRLKDAQLGPTQAEELGSAIRRVRQAGKKVRLFAEQFGPAELLVGSFADEVIIQSGGAVSLPGMYLEEMYLADTLEWIGVKADLVQIGDYKGASEALMNSAPSPAWEQNITQLLDGLYASMRSTLRMGRSLTEEQLDEAMRVAWMADADDAVAVRLVDAAVDLPLLGAHIAGKPDGEVSWVDLPAGAPGTTLDLANPFAVFAMLARKPRHKPSGPTIAVVHVDGVIVDGDSTPAGLFGGGAVGSRTIRNTLEDVLREDLIKGVIVRIDSPGGSATASEVIWQGLRRVAAKKPVWVSVGSMAASGGYYIAVGGDRIYVNPSSVVGSIGVVGGKISMGGLYEHLKIRVVSRARGPRADLFDSTRAWREAEVALVRAKMRETYDLFASRVRDGRKGIDLGKTAEGRLFTGGAAIGLLMADRVGGLDDAIYDLAEELKLARYDVMDYPGPKGLEDMMEEMFGGVLGAPGARAGAPDWVIGALREAVGPQAWPRVRDALEGLAMLRHHPVTLVAPRAIILR